MKWLKEYLGTPDSAWQALGWLALAVFITLSLVLDHVASTIYAIFFLAGLWLVIRRRHERPDSAMKWVLIAFAVYFAVSVLSFFLGEQTRLGEKILGRDIRFLGAVPVYFALAALAIPGRLLRLSLPLAGVVVGLVAVGEVMLTGGRADGRTVAIVFGHLAALLFAVNLALLLFRQNRRIPCAIAALLAATAVILSGTRGALLSMLAVALAAIPLLLAWRGSAMSRRPLLAASGVTLLVLVAGLAWLLPRIDQGVQQLNAYYGAMSTPPAEPRGCLAEPRLLEHLATHSRPSRRMEVDLATAELPDECDGGTAIHLSNSGSGSSYWLGPYRNVPIGAPGRVLVRGEGRVNIEGDSETLEIDSERFTEVDLPSVNEVDRTRIRVLLRGGESLALVPVEVLAGEYAFAAMESPVGNRLNMWAATWRQIDASLLGRGTGAWPMAVIEEAEQGRAAWRLSAYDHAHSDYLNALLERGVLGLLALLGVLFVPLAFALRRGPGWHAAAAMLVVVSVTVSALTETVFNHSIAITYYCMFVILLLLAEPGMHSPRSGNAQ